MNQSERTVSSMDIRLAKEWDLDDWMRLVRKEKDSFPGLETEAARRRLLLIRRPEKDAAICIAGCPDCISFLKYSEKSRTKSRSVKKMYK